MPPAIINNFVNGLPAVRFHAISNQTVGTALTGTNSIGGGPCTVFSVESWRSPLQRVWAFNASWTFGHEPTPYTISNGGGNTLYLAQFNYGVPPFGVFRVFAAQVTGTSRAAWINGVSVGSPQPFTGTLTTDFRLGSWAYTYGGPLTDEYFADVDIAEFIVYCRALSASEIQGVTRALASKYNLTF